MLNMLEMLNMRYCGTRLLILIVLAVLVSGCVKRAPRTDNQTQPEPVKKADSNKPCGLICHIKGDNEKKDKTAKTKRPRKEKTNKKPRTEKKNNKTKPHTYIPKGKGVYHTVKKGETFWRICITYGVDQTEVARANKIKDTTSLEVGQRIWIPGADKVMIVKVPALNGSTASSSTKYNYSKKRSSKKSSYTPKTSTMKGTLAWPVKGSISSRFGPRNGTVHEGLDISAPDGTPVYAAEDGKVTYADELRGYGNMIILKHAGKISTIYAHNKKNLVKSGDIVRKGQKIAEVGQTGKATGNHLHFEVRIGEKPVNPEFYLP
jgi:LysM repeat protein